MDMICASSLEEYYMSVTMGMIGLENKTVVGTELAHHGEWDMLYPGIESCLLVCVCFGYLY